MSKQLKHRKARLSTYLSLSLLIIILIFSNLMLGNPKINAQPISATIRSIGGNNNGVLVNTRRVDVDDSLPFGTILQVLQGAWSHLELINSRGRISPMIKAGTDPSYTEYELFCGPLRRGTALWGLFDSNLPNERNCERITVASPRGRGRSYSKFSKPDIKVANRLKASFPDTQGHWAETAINALIEQGIITGYEDGSFRPDAPVTRAEFAAIVNKAFGNLAPGRTEQDFPDTTSHWGSTSIRSAYARGFISGYPDGSFQPEGKIRRVEAVAALASGLNLAGSTALDSFYVDANQICGSEPSYGWACNLVSAATSSGIRIQGPDPDQFKPSQQASRADIAMFIYQALQGGFGSTGGQSEVVIEPSSSEASWILATATDDRVEVTVLGGIVNVGLGNNLKQASAGERFTIQANDAGAIVPLSAEERSAIANSENVATFLDASTWSPEVAPQLAQFQAYRDALLSTGSSSSIQVGAACTCRPENPPPEYANTVLRGVWETSTSPNAQYECVGQLNIDEIFGLQSNPSAVIRTPAGPMCS